MHPSKHQRKSLQNHQAPSMSPPHSHTQTAPVNQDDEGDICPICESECTCDNLSLSIAPQKHGLLPPLKVKVAAPSSSNPKPSGSNKQIRSKPSTSASTNHHLPQTGQFPVSDPRLKSHLLDPTIPKRRGRPPKVVVAARAALAAATANSSPERIVGISTPPRRPKAKFLKKIAKPRPKLKARGTDTIKTSLARRKRKVDDSYHPKGLVRRRPLVEDPNDSDDEDDDGLLLEDDDDVEPSAPLDLPTFISASSSSSESSSLSSLSSSEDSGLEDTETKLEEEQNIKNSEEEKERKTRKDKARVRRELLGENDPHQNGRPHHHNNRWDIKPRKRSVSASDGEADVDMGTESGDTTDSEDEDQDAVVADDEDEPDAGEVDRDGRRKLGVSFAGVVTGWSDGEDSNYDADLFFANLDSSGSDSEPNVAAEMSSMDADGEDGEQDSGDEIAEAMTLAAAAGLYDGWEGPIVFAARDVDVEMDLSPSPKPSRRRRMSSSILTTDDEQVGQRATDPTAGGDRLEEDNEIDLAESDGETTEGELIGVDGRPNARAMMLFKWPVSVGAVDPMNTLTPGRRGNGSAPRHSIPRHGPEDMDDNSDKSLDGIGTPNGKKSEVPRTPRGPVAGTFQLTPQSVEPMKTAVITGHQPALPSPYPRSRRLFSSGERAGHHSIRDRSLSVSGQSSVQTEGSSVPSQSTDLDLFITESMNLDDVLEAAFLASESSTSDAELSSQMEQANDRIDVGEMSSRSHVEDLRRWERIPMTAFRRTRESQGSISNDDGTPWSAKPGDDTDFYAVAMASSNLQHLLSSPTPAPSQKQTVGRTGLATLSSPISLGGPGSGGRGVRNFRMLTRDHKSEKERKEEKKALRKMVHAKPPLGRTFVSNHQAHHHHRHQHHPNAKSRASGSMQRTSFFNSPPTLGNP